MAEKLHTQQAMRSFSGEIGQDGEHIPQQVKVRASAWRGLPEEKGGRRSQTQDVDKCWWLVKRTVPLLRMLSSCTARGDSCGRRMSS